MASGDVSFRIIVCWAVLVAAASPPARAEEIPKAIEPFFAPPAQYAREFGTYRSPLLFHDGHRAKDASEWPARRKEILADWNAALGQWPPLLEDPKLEFLKQERRENFVQHRVRLEVAAGQTVEGWLLIPDGPAKKPAMLVLFYEPETSIGLGKNKRLDFGYQLARRGFVTLSIGSPGGDAWKPEPGKTGLQPLSYLAYAAANAHTALSRLPQVDPQRIGVMGHSYGGKWALFASCLYEKFATAVWSDPGIVFDETRPNVNYWEPWYLGRDPTITRKPGLPTNDNPRTGPYKKLVAEGHDLHELHALMAPRPFLVSGGSEDTLERWPALNHAIQVNTLLGQRNRVALTTRPTHDPTLESNAQIFAFLEYVLRSPTR